MISKPTRTQPLGPGLPRFRAGSSLPATPKLPCQEPEAAELSESDKATLTAVKPLHGKPDLQIKTIDRLMKYYK
ncbi:hypothetical protein [Spirosoma sp. KUDC1026]|uniref:hypothetical protein n=1 Tax=Spirosoma sp. KUDC1026 TaxID=2745947 RepID=UPI00159BB217|nr:hypothetical protein [Spirosoma sp. KUDC1026]QKZ15148.1 hypothetical protein HU175_22005 [Spirosoma sp. KUDC1026]